MDEIIRYVAAPDGVKIAYATQGTGMPLVILPGIVSHAPLTWQLTYSRLFKILSDKNLLVSFDPRGQGQSDREPQDISMDAYIEDLRVVLDELGLQRVALFGRSYSGPIAMCFAARYPERVSNLLLSNTYAQGASYFELPLVKALIPMAKTDWELFSVAARQARSNWLPLDELAERGHSFYESISPELYLRIFEQPGEFDASPCLSKIRVPSVVLYRANSNLMPAAFSKNLEREIRTARLVPIHADEDAAGIEQLCEAITKTLDAERNQTPPRRGPTIDELTAREVETLALLVRGLRNKEIASELNVKIDTVERHLANIYSKIGAHSRIEAANYARLWKLLPLD